MGYPTYQPLPSGVPAPLGVFATPAIAPDAFVQEDQKMALERAQELANQTNAFALQQKQQEEADKKQMEDALKSQYGNIDPNAPVDPKQVLDTMYRIAASQGNSDQMLKLGQQKILTGVYGGNGGGVDQATADSLGVPAGTPMNMVRAILQNRGQNDKNTRQEKTLGFKTALAQAPGIFENDVNPDGTPKLMNPTQVNTVGGIETTLSTILRNGSELVDEIHSDRYPIGDKAVLQASLVANMLPAIRQLDKQGVKFNQFIKNIDIQQLGDDPLGNDLLAKRILGTMTGQDPATAIDRFIHEIVSQSVIQAHSNNARVSIPKLTQFDPNAPAIFQKYGAFDVGQNNPTDPRNPLAVAGGLAGGQGANNQAAPFQVPNSTYQGVDSATGLPIFKRGS